MLTKYSEKVFFNPQQKYLELVVRIPWSELEGTRFERIYKEFLRPVAHPVDHEAWPDTLRRIEELHDQGYTISEIAHRVHLVYFLVRDHVRKVESRRRKAALLARKVKAKDLLRAGLNPHQIAQALGVSVQTARRDCGL